MAKIAFAAGAQAWKGLAFTDTLNAGLEHKWQVEFPSTFTPCQTFACQTFARLLKGSCRYEQSKLFLTWTQSALFACFWQKLELEESCPIDYESHALTI